LVPAVTLTARSCGPNPMRLARIRCAPTGTPGRLKVPSSRDIVPRCVPTRRTLTDDSGWRDAESTTRPDTMPVEP
jgi:hypothetical protein